MSDLARVTNIETVYAGLEQAVAHVAEGLATPALLRVTAEAAARHIARSSMPPAAGACRFAEIFENHIMTALARHKPCSQRAQEAGER